MPRNLSGVYTLPAGNPVVPGTTIDANWANSTLSDMANEITNSLSRTGAGGMLAPFRIDDGNVTGPGLAFLNETNTGFYRLAAGSTAFSVLGVNTLQMNTTSVTVPSNRTLNAQGNSLVGGTFGVTGAAAFASTLVATGAITALGGVLGNITAASGTSSFNDVTISGSLDMVAGSSATITGLSNPTNASDAANKGYVDTQDALKLSLSGGTMSGNIAMGNNLITGLGTAVSGGDATNKTYVDGQVATRLPLAGGTMSGAIAMSANKITGLGTPTADADAATKAYVDSVAQGLDVKGSVRAATTGNITLSGTQTIDGVAIGAGDRVLVKDQSTAANNGIYVAAAGAWSRAADADTWAELVGAFVFVEDGTVNDNSGWVCTSPPGGTLGVTAVTFEQFSGAGQINAGTGMTKTGNTLNVNTASSSRIVVGADEIDLAQTGVTAGTYKSVTVDLYGRVTAGTNPTTLSGYGITDAYTQTQTDTLLAGKLSLTGGTMSGAIAMGGSKITGLGTPTASGDAATKSYVDTQDALKLSLTGGTMTGAIAMSTNRITGLGDPVNAQDAATKNYIDTIFGSTSSAAASAAAAASSATAASTSATNAATSASNASTSATSAATSATNAATSLFNFRAQYLGPLASDPTVDGNGNAVTAGDLYWNTTVNETRIYNGTSWVAAYLPAAGYMDLTTNQTAAGVKTFSSNPILSGGTANGVAYLNGSKVLTTGSALTFNGSTLATSSANASFLSGSATTAGVITSGAAGSQGVIQFGSSQTTFNIQGGPDYLGMIYNIASALSHQWAIGGSEQARLTSTGLGIGTSSPASRFDVQMPASTNGGMTVGVNGTMNGTIGTGGFSVNGGALTDFGIRAANNLLFATGSGAPLRMALDSSGNLGLGVTPSAWNANSKVFQIGAAGGIEYRSTSLALTRNAVFNTSSQWQYIQSSSAGLYNIDGNVHAWSVAPSGTAGATFSFTTAMVLDGNGNLGIASVSPSADSVGAVGGIVVGNGTGNKGITLFSAAGTQANIAFTRTSQSQNGLIQYDHSGDYMRFFTASNERARITSGGNLLVGTTTDSGDRFVVESSSQASNSRLSTFRSVAAATGLSRTSIQLIKGAGNSYGGEISGYLEQGVGGGLIFSTVNDGTSAGASVERLRIGPAGQIGLSGANYGTSGQVLTSNGSGSAPTWQNAGAGSSQWTTSGSNIYYSTGNVGIGSATSNNTLSLYQATTPVLQLGNSTTTMGAGSGLQLSITGNDSTIYNQNGGYLRFGTAGSERARFESGGALCINTTSSTLNSLTSQVAVNIGNTTGDPNAAINIRRAYNAHPGRVSNYYGVYAQLDGSDQDGSFTTGAVCGNANIQTGAGVLGIGNYITSSGYGVVGLVQANTDGYGYGYSVTAKWKKTAGTGSNAGWVGFLAEDPDYLSTGQNTIGFLWNSLYTGAFTRTIASFVRNGSTIGSIVGGSSATTYNTTSDYRLKNNPQPLTGSGAFIDALQPKTWSWKIDGSRGVGFIAHEVQPISPSSVTGEKDAVDREGKPIMQAMEYGSAEFIANIIAELQSLRARVAQLEAK